MILYTPGPVPAAPRGGSAGRAPDPTEADWELLRALCRRAGIPPERVDRVAAAWAAAPAEGGITLLAGSPDTLALVLARWLGPEVARALPAGGATPLVIGPKPERVQPPLGRWPGRVHRKLGGRHVLAFAAVGEVPVPLRSALAGVGVADQFLLLSRVSQPFSADERALAASLSPLAATARVMFVALPSDEGSQAERAELAAYGRAQAEACGFRDRCDGAGVWYTEGARPADTIQRLDDWLGARAGDLSAGRAAAGRVALARLLEELEQRPDQPPDTTLTAEEADDLAGKFAHHVAALGRRVAGLADAGEFADNQACHAFVAGTLTGWAGRASLEGLLLDRADRVRPGIKAELPAQAQAAAGLLHYQPPPPAPARRRPAGAVLRRLLATVVVAAAAYAAIYLGATPFLRGWLVTVLSNVGATVGALAAFSLAGRTRKPPAEPTEKAAAAQRAGMPGWASAELRLTSWFNGRIRAQTPTLRQECAAIRAQFYLVEAKPS